MNLTEYVRDLAARIRAGRGPAELGTVAVSAVKDVWRTDPSHDDARTIIDAFPGDFPLIGRRAAD